jgi:hypothetical protein
MGFPSAVVLTSGQSVTGSFNKFQVMASGSVVTAGGSAFAVGHIKALRDGNNDLISFSSGSGLFLPPGTVVELMITSASLDTTSAPIMFFTI